jgi:hypothetical protein
VRYGADDQDRRDRPHRGRTADERYELSPPHELPSDEAHNLAHHWNISAPVHRGEMLDGFSFDLFPPFENDLAAPEVDVSRRQVVQALVVSTVVVVADELLDALFELS